MEPTQSMPDEAPPSHHAGLPTSPSLIGLSLALLGAIAVSVLLAAGLVLAWPELQHESLLGIVILGIAAGCIAAFAIWLRDIKKMWGYALGEIAAGVAIATQVAAHTNDPIVALVGFVGAVRLTMDGIARLRKFLKAYRLRRSLPQMRLA
jgi:hypothetical protein